MTVHTVVLSIPSGGSLADCDFEQGTICHYLQLPSTGNPHDEMDWTVHQGSSSTLPTGPNSDHTLGNTHGKGQNLMFGKIKRYNKHDNLFLDEDLPFRPK